MITHPKVPHPTPSPGPSPLMHAQINSFQNSHLHTPFMLYALCDSSNIAGIADLRGTEIQEDPRYFLDEALVSPESYLPLQLL